jgi:hypothetical protein
MLKTLLENMTGGKGTGYGFWKHEKSSKLDKGEGKP